MSERIFITGRAYGYSSPVNEKLKLLQFFSFHGEVEILLLPVNKRIEEGSDAPLFGYGEWASFRNETGSLI